MSSRIIESAEDIRGVLTDSQWRVRPPGNEVPAGLRGSLAGEVFARFARMSDGDDHQRRKQVVIELIASLETDAIPVATHDIVRRLHPATPRDLQFLVPGMVVCALLGVPESQQRTLVEQVRALVVGARPKASESDHAAAIEGMERAVTLITETFDHDDLTELDVVSSRISLMFQASDACAAAIGNALLLLSDMPEYADTQGEKIVRQSIGARVPVRNTSRHRGDDTAVLNLEAAHQQQPDADWTFGFGPHACPGQSMAIAIASACINAVIVERPFDRRAVKRVSWENLPNVWIPILTVEKEPET